MLRFSPDTEEGRPSSSSVTVLLRTGAASTILPPRPRPADDDDDDVEETCGDGGTSMVAFHVVRSTSSVSGQRGGKYLELMPLLAGLEAGKSGGGGGGAGSGPAGQKQQQKKTTGMHLGDQTNTRKRPLQGDTKKRSRAAAMARALLFTEEAREAWPNTASLYQPQQGQEGDEQVLGWVSDRNCRFPQEIGLRILHSGRSSSLRCVQITALRHMLPRHVDIYAAPDDHHQKRTAMGGTVDNTSLSGGDVRGEWSRAYKRAVFTFRARVHFLPPTDEENDSTAPSAPAGPYVSRLVPLRIPACRFIRIILHEPYYSPSHNPHHQLGLHSIHLIGSNALIRRNSTKRKAKGGDPSWPSPACCLDDLSSMRAAVLREIGVSPTIIETVILGRTVVKGQTKPFKAAEDISADLEGEGEGAVLEDRPFSALELRREELRYLASEAQVWRTRYRLHLPASTTGRSMLEDDLVEGLAWVEKRATAARAEEGREAEVTQLVKEAADVFRALNRRLAQQFRDVVWGPAAAAQVERDYGARAGRLQGSLEGGKLLEQSTEEEHSLGPLLYPKFNNELMTATGMGQDGQEEEGGRKAGKQRKQALEFEDMCGVSAQLLSKAQKGRTSPADNEHGALEGQFKAAALTVYRTTLECLVGKYALRVIVTEDSHHNKGGGAPPDVVRGGEVLRLCESKILNMLEAVDEILLMSSSPPPPPQDDGHQQNSQPPTDHLFPPNNAQDTRARHEEVHAIVFRALMALAMEAIRSPELDTFHAALHLIQTLLQHGTNRGGKAQGGKKDDAKALHPTQARAAPSLSYAPENLHLEDVVWGLDDLCFVLCLRASDPILCVMQSHNPASLLEPQPGGMPVSLAALTSAPLLSAADTILLFLCDQPNLGPCLVTSCLLHSHDRDPAGRLLLYGSLLEEFGLVDQSPLSETRARGILHTALTHPKAAMRLLGLDILIRVQSRLSPATVKQLLDQVSPPLDAPTYKAYFSRLNLPPLPHNSSSPTAMNNINKTSSLQAGTSSPSQTQQATTSRKRAEHTSHISTELPAETARSIHDKVHAGIEEMRKTTAESLALTMDTIGSHNGADRRSPKPVAPSSSSPGVAAAVGFQAGGSGGTSYGGAAQQETYGSTGESEEGGYSGDGPGGETWGQDATAPQPFKSKAASPKQKPQKASSPSPPPQPQQSPPDQQQQQQPRQKPTVAESEQGGEDSGKTLETDLSLTAASPVNDAAKAAFPFGLGKKKKKKKEEAPANTKAEDAARAAPAASSPNAKADDKGKKQKKDVKQASDKVAISKNSEVATTPQPVSGPASAPDANKAGKPPTAAAVSKAPQAVDNKTDKSKTESSMGDSMNATIGTSKYDGGGPTVTPVAAERQRKNCSIM